MILFINGFEVTSASQAAALDTAMLSFSHPNADRDHAWNLGSCRKHVTMYLDDIAAGLQEEQDDNTGWILGPGSTTLGLLEAMGLEGTLLGVDVLKDGELLLRDATEQQLWEQVEQGGDWRILVTAIGASLTNDST